MSRRSGRGRERAAAHGGCEGLGGGGGDSLPWLLAGAACSAAAVVVVVVVVGVGMERECVCLCMPPNGVQRCRWLPAPGVDALC
jgi:hypothetical protein